MKQVFQDFEKASKKSTPRLHLAVRMGDLNAVLLLLDDEEANSKNHKGSTALQNLYKLDYI